MSIESQCLLAAPSLCATATYDTECKYVYICRLPKMSRTLFARCYANFPAVISPVAPASPFLFREESLACGLPCGGVTSHRPTRTHYSPAPVQTRMRANRETFISIKTPLFLATKNDQRTASPSSSQARQQVEGQQGHHHASRPRSGFPADIGLSARYEPRELVSFPTENFIFGFVGRSPKKQPKLSSPFEDSREAFFACWNG